MDDFGFVPGWSKSPAVPRESNGRGGGRSIPYYSGFSPIMKHDSLASSPANFHVGDSSSNTNIGSVPSYYDCGDYSMHYGFYGSQMGSGGYSTVPSSPMPISPNPTSYGMRGRGFRGFRGEMHMPFPKGGTFPRKREFGMISNDYRLPKKKSRDYVTTGKSAAMILNELYPSSKDTCTFQAISGIVPRFKCSVTVDGRDFSAEASSKKIAKQLVCERALKSLRPSMKVDTPSYEESEANKLAALEARTTKSTIRNEKNADLLKTSNSLHDFFLKLCRKRESESDFKFDPIFKFEELADDNRAHSKRFKCTLTLAEQSKTYVSENTGKNNGKNSVIRQALRELFGVSDFEMTEIIRHSLNLRHGTPSQVLLQALNFFGRSMQINVAVVSGTENTKGNRFVATVTLDDDKEIIGPTEETAAQAKNSVCLKVLTEDFGLRMPSFDDLTIRRTSSIFSPCYALHHLMMKDCDGEVPNMTYSDAECAGMNDSKQTLFKCQLTVNNTHVFTGSGISKKAAKNDAACLALKQLFQIDMASKNASEMLRSVWFRGENDLEFSKAVAALVRSEYEKICVQYACPPTNHISAFVLVDPNDQKTLVALGAGRNAIVDGRALANNPGNVLIHLQSVVLARRSLLLYLHKRIERFNEEDSILEFTEETKKFRLKLGYRLVLYMSFPPNVQYNSAKQKLSCYFGDLHTDTASDYNFTFDEMISSGKISVMSIADKILKWNVVGLQGALLSYFVEPIFMSNMVVYVTSNERDIKNAILLRTEKKRGIVVKSLNKKLSAVGEIYHDWVAGIGQVERLDPILSRTVNGSPSRLCKSELFENWNRLVTMHDLGIKLSKTYMEVKRDSHAYMYSLSNFHTRLVALGLGEWLRKDRVIDNFGLSSSQ